MRSLLALLTLTLPLVAAPVPKALKRGSDAERIVGRWVIVSGSNGPTAFEREVGDVWVMAAAGEKSIQLIRGGGTTYPLAYSFPTPGERHLDVACNNNPYQGVYELDGDTLTIAFANHPRPTTTEQAKGVFVYHFRREEAK